MAFILDYDSNLISLGQLQENGIRFHNNPITMTLKRGKNIIAYTKRSHNLFVFNMAIPGLVMSAKVMAITG